jgi:2-amino-4-hydroxy-6-hydroxymethyldihydropteridine diphosphokinase
MNAPHWRPAYIGVGSNLDSPEDQVRNAIDSIGDLPDSVFITMSGLYRSSPMGPADQPDFVNAVVAIVTQMSAVQLLAALQDIEQEHGRTRDVERWGPRTLDLDLLAFAGQVIESEELTVPHPGIAGRNFVLLPWQEIAPRYRLPGGADIAGLASQVSLTEPRIERIG